MPLNPTPPRSRRQKQRTRATSLTAAAESLTDRLERQGGAQVSGVGEAWQREVWDLYDKVPELRTAARVTGTTMSQCRLTLARISPNGGDPTPLPADENHPGKDLLAAFAGGMGGQADLLDAIGVALTVPGETIMVGSLDPRDALKDDFLRMQAYSTEQVRQSNGQVFVKLDESSRSERVIDLRNDAEVQQAAAIRVWRPHPRFSWQADSAARSALSVLGEIALYDDHIHASGISRLAGAGLLGIPEGMTLPGLDADDDIDEDADPFMQLLMKIMALAIKDRKSAAALVPILLRGTPEDIAAIRHIVLDTPFNEKVVDMRDRAVGRLGVAVDMPPEVLTGMGSTQGWVGSLITDDWKKTHLQSLMGLATGSITTGWYYPALAATGNGNLPADTIVWFDDSNVRTRENTGPEALSAYTNGAINVEAYRRAIGYSNTDAVDLTTPEGKREFMISLLYQSPGLLPVLGPALGLDIPTDSAAILSTPSKRPAGLAPEGPARSVPEPRSLPDSAV